MLLTTVTNHSNLAISNTISNVSFAPPGEPGNLILNGPNADISINGVSLNSTLASIQQRLNILQPNKELEAEWEQLRELGEQYRALEAQLLAKQKMWETLKK